MTKVSIIILNWNRTDDTVGCLQSIRHLQVSNYQLSVVVVDNGSTDNTVKVIKNFKLQNPNLKLNLLENKSNLGFVEGNNVGIRFALNAGADYILVLNNDTIVDKHLLVNLIHAVEKYPKTGAVSPKIYFAKGYEFHKKRYKKEDLGKVIWYAGGLIDWNNVYGTNRGVDEIDSGQLDKTIETDFFTGAAVLFNSRCLKETELFDKRYYMYLEDSDLTMRMKLLGWKVYYSPDAFLWHKVAQSSAIGSDLNDYFITRNRLMFGLKYAPVRSKLALIKESAKFLVSGRKWQKIGVKDFYLRRFGKGSWK